MLAGSSSAVAAATAALEAERPIEELFTEDQLETYKEVFAVFDKDEDGKLSRLVEFLKNKSRAGFVAAKEIGSMLRAVAQNPLKSEIKSMVLEMDPLQIGNKVYDIQAFLRYVSRRMKEYDTEEELREAFRVFDKEQNGQVSATELREAMTTLGEPFTEEEANMLMKDCKVNAEGTINFHEISRSKFIPKVASFQQLQRKWNETRVLYFSFAAEG